MNWRTATVLLGLCSVMACAKATLDDGYPSGEFISNGGDDTSNGGGSSDEGGAPPAGGAAPTAGAMTGGSGAPARAGAPGGAGAPGHAGAAATGGKGGTSSGGAPGTAGKSGVSGGTAMGGSAGAPVTGPCANPKDLTGGKSDAVGADAGCFRTIEKFNSLGCSNFTGRTITVNGMLNDCTGMKDTFAPAIDGYNYFEVSAGGVAYASFYWFSS